MNEITLNEKFHDLISDSTPRRKAAKIPKIVYLYMPKGNEIVEFDEKRPTKTLRRIFQGCIEYLPFEKTKIEEFQKYIDDSNEGKDESEKFKLPEFWSDDQTLRCLQSYEYNNKTSLDNVKKYIDWVNKTLPIQPSNKVCEILNIGFIYSHGRDNRFRPNVILKIKEFKENYVKYSFEDWTLSIIFCLEDLIKNLLVKGQVENWNIIVDCTNASLLSLPPDLKKLLQILSDNYKCRLHTMYVLNLSFFLMAIWQIIKNVLDPITQRKIILTESGSEDLFQRMNRSQLEAKFGGTANNVTEYYFPHIQPSEDYLKEGENQNDILVSEEDYMKLVLEDSRFQRSPYYVYEDEIINEKEDNSKKLDLSLATEDENSNQLKRQISDVPSIDTEEDLDRKASVYVKVCNTESRDTERDENPNLSLNNNELNISQKNERENNIFVDNSNKNSRLNSLNKLYLSILIQSFVCILDQQILHIFQENYILNTMIITLALISTIFISLILIRKYQEKIKENRTIALVTSLSLSLMGSLIIVSISNIYLNYTLFLIGILILYIYYKYLSEKVNEPQILLIVLGLNLITVIFVYATLDNNILFICASFFISIYFSLCLFLYSQFALSNNLISFEKNALVYNLTSFTCELFIFPYTLIIDVYYKNCDIRKSLNFGFISV